MNRKSASKAVISLFLVAIALLFICVVLFIQTKNMRDSSAERQQQLATQLSSLNNEIVQLQADADTVKQQLSVEQSKLEEANAELATARSILNEYTTKKS